MAEVVTTVIKCLSWRAAIGYRIHCDGSGHSTLSDDSRPTTSISPGASPPSAHISHLCLCSQQHSSPQFWIRIWIWGCVSWIATAEWWCWSYIHHVRCSKQCGHYMILCVRALWEGSNLHYFYIHQYTPLYFYLCGDFHRHSTLASSLPSKSEQRTHVPQPKPEPNLVPNFKTKSWTSNVPKMLSV